MASSTKDKEQPTAQEEPPVQPEQRLDKTVPGGRYLVSGKWLNANGKPLPEPAQPDTKG